QTRSQMRSFLLDVWQQSHKTILFITHSVDEAVFLSQKLIGFSRRPATCGLELAIEMPYQRDVTTDAFNVYRRRILTFLDEQKA
ncbi:MAG: nitrate ABC transporter ATP-binding protein, partial [Deltaproteobacteria bacterium]|nr:nitrate ABC transporter ATP-binding protein [Deltaproteobacteria bacterium]